MSIRAFIAPSVFDGIELHQDHALIVDGGRVHAVVPQADVPPECEKKIFEGGTILPGFVDLQANGGGGVMFNEATSLDGLVAIAGAHAQTGTRALLPTLITDSPERTHAALEAVEQAIAHQVPGILGIHLEGPHLSIARKGAHAPDLIRRMSEVDEAVLLKAAKRLPNVLVTVAIESVSTAQIGRLTQAGVIVSIGHSDCTANEAQQAFSAGARSVTHLFNAMSQMSARAPGLVGAALGAQDISAGLIADNIHVDPTTMRAALAAKRGTGEIYLVTDAMSPLGSQITEFQLNGRRVLRRQGRLTLEDGTLAGADLTLPQAISNLVNSVGISPKRAFRMVTGAPAALLNKTQGYGTFRTGAEANAIWIDADYQIVQGL